MHSGEFLHPLAFRFIKTLAQAVKDSVIADLDMIVALWIVRDEKPVGDHVLETEARYLLSREVGPIVRDDGMRKPLDRSGRRVATRQTRPDPKLAGLGLG